MSKARRFDAAKYLDDPKAIAKYLNDALSTGDPVHITKAIGAMVRAQGVTRFSQKNGMDRTSIYRSFSGNMKPPFETVLNVLTALDIQLIAKPSAGFYSLGLKAKGK
jgi:probable addiction module antidote protein